MIQTIKNLSSTTPLILHSVLGGVEYSKVERTFFNGFDVIFYDAFDNVVDYSTKNHTKFYLTREQRFDDIIVKNDKAINPESLFTTLRIGGQYIKFGDPIGSTGDYTLDPFDSSATTTNIDDDNTKFFLEIFGENECRIYHLLNNRKYYLTLISNSINTPLLTDDFEMVLTHDGDNILLSNQPSLIELRNIDDIEIGFVSEQINLAPILFDFISTNNELYLFYYEGNKVFTLSKILNNIHLVELLPSSTPKPLLTDKNIFMNIGSVGGQHFISYTDDNNIAKSDNNVNNNFLLHRTDNFLNIICLKNQLSQHDIFSSGNNNIFNKGEDFYVDRMREYTSIFKSIEGETDSNLAINYVFYNKPYIIKSGINRFKSPDNMGDFIKLNINDTKFVDAGSFPYPTPEFADKVYLKDDNINTLNGQYLLCTWLSGSPISNDRGVWVDRYYYPDLISKEEALSSENFFNDTYENDIESLISNDQSISNHIKNNKFFDKVSDLVFRPNHTYEYHRLKIDVARIDNLINDDCNEFGETNISYFKNINEIGQLAISFHFDGDDKEWEFESKGEINDSGVSFEKNVDEIILKVNLSDTSTNHIEKFKIIGKFNKLKVNFVGVSINTITGEGYLLLNQNIVQHFNFKENKYFNKKLLFKDFTMNGGGVLKRIEISDEYIPPYTMAIKPITNGLYYVDDIYITLPCGMRNSTDEFNLLQTACSNYAFKSNKYNIVIKNTDLDSDISNELIELLKNSLKTPSTSNINEITFKTYK